MDKDEFEPEKLRELLSSKERASELILAFVESAIAEMQKQSPDSEGNECDQSLSEVLAYGIRRHTEKAVDIIS